MTEPLTPAGCDLQDFPFMPLDVARLRDSELTTSETPEACWAALLLWCTSWHQVPAGSLPDDEKWIADKAGYVARGKVDKAWKSVQAGAMRGWVLCSDGRYYHPVVCEKARDAWQAKLRQRWGTECARIKKHNDRHEGANVPKPTFDEWVAQGCPQGQPLFVPRDSGGNGGDVPGERHSKRQGEGQGQRQGEPKGVGGAAADAPGTPAAKAKRGERLPEGWTLPRPWGEWTEGEFPSWSRDYIRLEGQKFADFWHAKSGKDATKLDWEATWRNWCRNAKGPSAKDAPQASQQTVASGISREVEETRRRLAEEDARWEETKRARAARKAAEAAATAAGQAGAEPQEQAA